MSDNTKLYNTVKVQKLEAELQLISENGALLSSPPLLRASVTLRSQFCALKPLL